MLRHQARCHSFKKWGLALSVILQNLLRGVKSRSYKTAVKNTPPEKSLGIAHKLLREYRNFLQRVARKEERAVCIGLTAGFGSHKINGGYGWS